MNFNIPPIIPYAVGAMLVVFGVLRVKYLSAPRLFQENKAGQADDGAGETPSVPTRGKDQKRHLRMGILWVAMGLFLVFSTYLQLRKQG